MEKPERLSEDPEIAQLGSSYHPPAAHQAGRQPQTVAKIQTCSLARS